MYVCVRACLCGQLFPHYNKLITLFTWYYLAIFSSVKSWRASGTSTQPPKLVEAYGRYTNVCRWCCWCDCSWRWLTARWLYVLVVVVGAATVGQVAGNYRTFASVNYGFNQQPLPALRYLSELLLWECDASAHQYTHTYTNVHRLVQLVRCCNCCTLDRWFVRSKFVGIITFVIVLLLLFRPTVSAVGIGVTVLLAGKYLHVCTYVKHNR